ncbi:MAG: biphenyl-2,3-diol 1,2-dioxygenase, partial [Deltaproteobacteria bacterium]
MDEIRQLGYMGIGASDMAAWEAFASDVLGMQAAPRNDEVSDAPLHLRMDDYERRITVHPNGSDDVEYLGLEVAGKAQLEIMQKRLESAGFTTEWGSDEEAADRFVVALLKVADPDGVAIEIYFGPLLRVQEPFHSPRPISGFVAGELGLGHAVLCVSDMESSLAFYRDVLGFRISDLITFEPVPGFEVTITFLHCNPRH